MLQQTQVDRVRMKYQPFLRQFPDLASLAKAPMADVLRAWQGLGYNRRAMYLRRAAQEIVARQGSALPRDPVALARLPGIGRATAGAIAAFAFQTPAVFIETNIRRVYIHFFFSKKKSVHDRDIMPIIAAAMSRKNPREWYYALMDYGAMLGREKGRANPNRHSRHYAVQSPFRGSQRERRGKILKALLADPSLAVPILAKQLHISITKTKTVRSALQKEGLLL